MPSTDDRIVAMKFDNRSFEQKIAGTLDSLDKLKKSLDFANTSKGLSDLSAASRSFSLDGIGSAVENINNKFSAMGAVAFSVISNITSRAISAGEALAKGLSLDQVIGGYREYETNINSIQTILANTQSKGSTLEDVNNALDDLNTYSDQTIYNFSQMTKNIGTFTSAGVDLKTSTSSIKGIANIAAISGSNAEQASTAMYQLSQALASGSVKLMDWNSVVNAGMGGEIFQKALFETGKSLHTIQGVKLDTTFEDWKKAGNTFRGSLEKGWLTADVLTNTLQGFTGDLSEAQLTALGYTKEQAQEMMKLGTLGKEAATKVKTLTQLLSTVKEAVGSGWSASFRTIFGDFEEARTLFTGWNAAIGNVVSASSSSRKKILDDWKALGGRTDLINSINQAFKDVILVLRPIKQAFREIFPRKTGEDLARITKNLYFFLHGLEASPKTMDTIKRVFKGLFAAFEIGFTIIKAIGRVFKELLSVFAGVGGSPVVGFIAKISDGLVSLNEKLVAGQGIERFVQTIFGGIFRLRELVGAFVVWFKLGFDGAFINVDRVGNKLIKTAFKIGAVFREIGDAIQHFRDGISGKAFNDGRGVLGFLNQLGMLLGGNGEFIKPGFLKSIVDGVKKIGDAFSYLKDTVLKSAISNVKGFFTAIQNVAGNINFGKFTEPFKKLASFDFSKLAAPFKSLWSGIETSGGKAATVFTAIASALAVVAKAVGSFSISAFEKIKNVFVGLLGGMKGVETKVAGGASSAIGGGFSYLSKAGERLGSVWGALSTGLSKLKDALVAIGKAIGNALKGIWSAIDRTFGKAGFDGALDIANTGIFAALALLLDKFLRGGLFFVLTGSDMSKTIKGVFTSISGTFTAFQQQVKAGALMKIAIAVGVLTASLVVLSLMDSQSLTRGLLAISGSLYALTKTMEALAKIQTDSKQTGGLVAMAGSLSLIGIALIFMAKAVNMFGSMDPTKLSLGLAAVAGVLYGLSEGLKRFTTALSSMGSTKPSVVVFALLGIAAAIKTLAKVVEQFANMDPMKLFQGLSGIAGVMALLAVALKEFPNDMVKKTEGMLLFSIALNIIARTIEFLGSLNPEVVVPGMAMLVGVLAVIVKAMKAMPQGEVFGLGAALLQMSLGMLAMAFALQIIGLISWEGLALGLAAFIIILDTLTTALVLLEGALPGAYALIVASGALLIFAVTLEKIAAISWGNIFKGIVAIVAILAIVGVALLVFTAILDGVALGAGIAAGPLLALGAAIFLIGAGIALLGTGVLLIAKAVGVLSKLGETGKTAMDQLIASVTDALPNLIKRLAAAFLDMATMVIKMMPKLIDALIKMLMQLLPGLRKVIPELGKTVGVLIDTLLKLIVDKSPDITKAGYSILLDMIKGLRDNTKDITKAVSEMITEFLKELSKQLPTIIDAGTDLLTAFLDGIAAHTDEVTKSATNLISQFIKGMTDAIVGLAQDFINLVKAIGGAIVGTADEITKQSLEIIKAIFGGMIVATKSGAQYVKDLIIAICKAIADTSTTLGEEVPQVVVAIFKAMVNATDDITRGVGDFIVAMCDTFSAAIDDKSDAIARAGGKLAGSIVSAMADAPGQAASGFWDKAGSFFGGVIDFATRQTPGSTKALGDAIIDGLVGTVESPDNKAKLHNAGVTTWGSYVGGFTSTDGAYIKSPSRKMITMAGHVVTGFVKGIDSNTNTATNSAVRFSTSVIDAFRKTLQAVPDLGLPETFNPTITPVLDLTNVQRDAAGLGSLLAANPISATVSADQAHALSVATVTKANQTQDTQQVSKEVKFEQNIYAPTALNAAAIYRQTKSQITLAKEELITA